MKLVIFSWLRLQTLQNDGREFILPYSFVFSTDRGFTKPEPRWFDFDTDIDLNQFIDFHELSDGLKWHNTFRSGKFLISLWGKNNKSFLLHISIESF